MSALGKLFLAHRETVDFANTLPVWLGYLPLKCDLEEAVIVNEQLCQMLERYVLAIPKREAGNFAPVTF